MASIINPVTTFDPWEVPTEPVRRFTVAEYHQLIEMGFFGEDESYELIEGWLVPKMTKNPPHEFALAILTKQIIRQLPDSWECRCQLAMTLADGEPEPDIAIVKGPASRYAQRHPAGADTGLIIEVSDVTLRRDQGPKLHSYARAGIPDYWIVDVNAHSVHVYANPMASGDYQSHRVVNLGETLAIRLQGVSVPVVVSELFAS